jgi:hypothetical protein
LRAHGCRRDRAGGQHEIWVNPATEASAAVPNHREINTFTGRGICRDLGIPAPRFR